MQCFAKRDGLGGDDVHQRSTLHAGEHSRVDFFRNRFVIGHDQTTARAAKRFVSGGRDDVGMGERRRMHARSDEACDVRDVRHQQRAALVSDFAEAFEIDDAWIS